MIKGIELNNIKNNKSFNKVVSCSSESDFTSIINSISKINSEVSNNDKQLTNKTKDDNYNVLSSNVSKSTNNVKENTTKNLKSENKAKKDSIYKGKIRLKNCNSTNLDKNKVTEEEDIEEDVTELKESLINLVSLLCEFNREDTEIKSIENISVEDLLSSDEDLIEFITSYLNEISTLLDDVNEEAVALLPEAITESLNIISNVLEAKGIKGNEVSTLLENFKELVQASDLGNEEFKAAAEEIINELTTSLNASKSELNNTIIASNNSVVNNNDTVVDSNDVNNNLNRHKKIEATEETTDNDSSEESLEDNSEETSTSLTKDEKVLKSILNNSTSDNAIVNRFAIFSNDYSITSGLKTVDSVSIGAGTAAHDVVQAIKFMTSEGIDELMVKVNPRGLGELIISIVKEGDMMRAEIKASSKETYNLMLQNADDIKKYLGEQNIKVHNVDISLTKDSTDNHSFFNESHNENGNRNNSKNPVNYGDGEFIEEENDLPEELINSINMLV